MEEIKAIDIMEAYNAKYSPKVSLMDVERYLQNHAFFAMPPELAAIIMHDKILG